MKPKPDKATRALIGLLAFFAIVFLTVVTFAVLLTLQLTGVASIHIAVFIAVLLGGAFAASITPAIAMRGTRGRARNITDHGATTVNVFTSLRDDLDDQGRRK